MNASTGSSARPGKTPAVLRDGWWWLVGGSGSVPLSDPSFVAVLDGFAEALAAADRTVAALRPRPDGEPALRTGDRR
ncbi:hypothetical protein ACIQHY_12880 [Streptomyces sp. NPDC092359]|uniref:hypothetical protein n=1 Tax=Streptomyces sp. NPDC092359 TaxID=3366014 RepID=UPI00381FB67D